MIIVMNVPCKKALKLLVVANYASSGALIVTFVLSVKALVI